MNNQYYKADVKQQGKILLPYLPSDGNKTSKAILLHKGLAQFVDVIRKEEQYTLNCGFYILPESIIMGKNATIMITPKLMINGRITDLQLLKNIRCTLYTINYVDNIPITKTYKNLVLSNNKELLLKFQVGANLKELRIEFTADIKNVSKDRTQTLTSSYTFPIYSHYDKAFIADMYLKLAKDKSYELYVLGKNGEPIKNMPVSFTLTAQMLIYTLELNATTNENGMIKLGKLKGITKFTASIQGHLNSISLKKQWVLPSEVMLQYPEIIDIIEDEEINLPISIEDTDNKLFLKSVNNAMVLSNMTNAIKVSSNKGDLYATVKISSLKNGTYKLTGIGNFTIKIKVHKGVHWSENPNWIIKQYSLIENTERQGFIKISNVNVEEGKEGKSYMKLKVEGATQNQ